ncbi:MAG: lamin tail domain-containing protein [Clostridiales bacterium]|nr:lamin tail domain-containing protein [Clostridiales bacterium]
MRNRPSRFKITKQLPKALALLALAFVFLFAACDAFSGDPADPYATRVPDSGKKPAVTSSPTASLGDVYINEVVSANSLSHLDDEFGAVDWVELYNASSSPADISGFRLCDTPTMENALVFPEGTVIPASGFLTVLCIPGHEASERDGVLIASFGISRAGEKLYFADAGSGMTMLNIPHLFTDVSYARQDDGSYGYCAAPTFGKPNANVKATLDEAAASIVAADDLRFSELVIGNNGWVELKNVSDKPIYLIDYYLSDNDDDPTKWQFPNVALLPGGYVVVELNALDPDNELTASFKVSRSEGVIYLFNNLHKEIHRMEVDVNMPDGVSAVIKKDGSLAYTCYVTKGEENKGTTFDAIGWTEMDINDSAKNPLIINEVLPKNKYGITDAYGDRSDWVELLNTSDNPVYLSHYYLSDDEGNPLKFQLPNVALMPHSYALIFLSGNESIDGEIHAPFRLSDTDGVIILSSLDGMRQDRIEIPEGLNPNVSIGRNGQNQIRYYAAPTPGKMNNTYGVEQFADAGGFNARSVYISEVCAVNPARSGVNDWIELYNGSQSAIQLTGWYLTDDPSDPSKYPLDKYSLTAGGYAVINCGYAPFNVSNGGDTLYLINSSGAVCDVFQTGMTTVGVTSGRANLSQTGERVFFTTATRGFKNASPLPGYAAEPEFSSTKLYYSESVSVEITCRTPGAVIRYTTDGSVPTSSSKLYEGPIKLTKSTSVRARAFLEGRIASPTATHTYVIGSQHTMPVVCISLSHSDYEKMYVAKMGSQGGVTKGAEVPCFMEYYVDGRLAISSGAGVRVSGASTAVYPQKSLGLYFRAGYGRSSLDFPLFDGSGITSFRAITLRNGGQDAYYAHIRDAYMSTICRGMNIDVAYFKPVVVYMNGQYRGVYDMKENLNEDYLVTHYGVKRSTVEIAKRNGYMLAGNDEQWTRMREMCKTLDFSKQENFDKLAKIIDTDSIIDYLIARTYFYDGDMFNQKYWHTTDNKIKWRAVFYDSDYAMFGNNPRASILSAYFNKNGVSSAHGFITNMDIFCALNQNKAWREKFIIRYIYMAKYRFNKERALPMFDRLVETYRPEMSRHISKWHMPSSMDKWQSELAALRSCIEQRPQGALNNLKRYYGLSDEVFKAYEKQADAMAN